MKRSSVIGAVLVVCLQASPLFGQDTLVPPTTTGPNSASAAAPPAGDKPAFKPEELEQMLAPIALYPDSLIAQVLMAATYPIEVVEADRWVSSNKELKGDALAAELDKKSWDESVKSLCGFPQVLSTMSQNLSTTVKIGDAMIGQSKEVMATIQKLRAKAQAEGNLKTTAEQNVTTKVEGGTQVIVVESSNPEVVYVPQYNPTVVYGGWPYPAYPPYPYYPPGYVAGTAAISFGVGMVVGACWANAWGNCNWGGGDIDIDSNRNVNRNVNRNSDRNRASTRQQGSFKHNPSHRQGAAYRNQSSANRVGAGQSSNRASAARSDYRGKAEAGRADIARGGADSFKGNSPANRGGGAGGGATRAPSTANRAANTGSKSSAFGDSNRSGADTRAASNRGSSSRSSSPSASRSSGSRSSGGASRGGGGGGRGGGGRGGGGRR